MLEETAREMLLERDGGVLSYYVVQLQRSNLWRRGHTTRALRLKNKERKGKTWENVSNAAFFLFINLKRGFSLKQSHSSMYQGAVSLISPNLNWTQSLFFWQIKGKMSQLMSRDESPPPFFGHTKENTLRARVARETERLFHEMESSSISAWQSESMSYPVQR